MHNSALVRKLTKTLWSISAGLTLQSNNSSTKEGIDEFKKLSGSSWVLIVAIFALVLSNPPTQRKVKMSVKWAENPSFTEIGVDAPYNLSVSIKRNSYFLQISFNKSIDK